MKLGKNMSRADPYPKTGSKGLEGESLQKRPWIDGGFSLKKERKLVFLEIRVHDLRTSPKKTKQQHSTPSISVMRGGKKSAPTGTQNLSGMLTSPEKKKNNGNLRDAPQRLKKKRKKRE